MSSFFFLNNFHFFLEIFGALVFLIAAWLAFDSLIVRRDFITASRAIGFVLLSAGQLIHAVDSPSEKLNLFGYAAYFSGIFFVLLTIVKESMVKRPEFKAILLLPGLSVLAKPFNAAMALGFFLITLFSFLQYKKEFKKSLLPFWLGFLFLTAGALLSIFEPSNSLTLLWMAGHFFEFAGFFSLAAWVWSYLHLRIREELLLIFISFALIMAVLVSLTFSTILIDKIEAQTKNGLSTDVKVLDLTIFRLKEEALAKSKLLAEKSEVKKALAENDFPRLEAIAELYLEKEKLGFLTILDEEGNVILRAHNLTKKDDSLVKETAVQKALTGEPFAYIESSPVEKFSIRAASAMIDNGEIVGVILAGFSLDNALADSLNRITGLEMSIFEGNVRVATAALNPDGRTRPVGIKQPDPAVNRTVLKEGGALTLSTTIDSRPFLASYLPIKNSDGAIAGMISAAKPKEEVLETANATNRLTLLVVIILMLIFIIPIYFVTRRLSEEMS